METPLPPGGKENGFMPIPASFGRTIRYLRISAVDRCNLRCAYCMPAGRVSWLPGRQLLTFDEIERVVRCGVRAGIRKVRLTGGEPLLRPGLADLVARLRRIEGLREIAMTTNGTLLARAAADLKSAGLDRLNVSLDSLNPETFAAVTRGGSLCDVLAGLEAAAAAGFALKLNTVVMRGINDAEAPRIARFGLERGWSVRFIEYMPMGCGAADWRERFVPAVETLGRLEEALGSLTPVTEGAGSDPARRYRVAGYEASIGLISSISEPFCGTCDRLRLTADGRIRSCLLAPGEADVRALLRGGAPDEEITAALARAAGMKPEWHGITVAGAGIRVPQQAMSQIGG